VPEKVLRTGPNFVRPNINTSVSRAHPKIRICFCYTLQCITIIGVGFVERRVGVVDGKQKYGKLIQPDTLKDKERAGRKSAVKNFTFLLLGIEV